jgi:hypothetical protein
MQALLKLKGDILADAELPLVHAELRGLLGTSVKQVELSCSYVPTPFRELPEFCRLVTRKPYKGSIQAFIGTLDVYQLDLIRKSSTYVSDVFAWPQDEDSATCLNKLLRVLLSQKSAQRGTTDGAGFRIYRTASEWLVHLVPVYWYIEYASHALSCCASPTHAGWAAQHLIDSPFSLKEDRLSRRIFGPRSYTTAHFTHGLHQYKGKFFPRMVRALMNAHRPKFVVDPFCGSGTLQAEAMTAGYASLGFDLNPVAVNICKMKEEILDADPDEFDSYYRSIAPDIGRARRNPCLWPHGEGAASEWPEADFPHDLAASLSSRDLRFIRSVQAAVEHDRTLPYSHVLLMVLSDCLKSKVRVRVGGKTAFFYSIEPNKMDLPTLFRQRVSDLSTFLHFWQRLQQLTGIQLAKSQTLEGDARNWPALHCHPDLIITSPPYFPYTGISYVYTNLAAIAVLGIKNLRALEERMIGNTLNGTSALDEWLKILPEVVKLFGFLETDKYRRARIPVYARYFSNLRLVFRQMKEHCASDADVRFVVAKFQKLYRMHENRTLHEIDCAAIIRAIAEREGLAYEGQVDIPLFKNDKVSLFPSNEGIEVVLHFRT